MHFQMQIVYGSCSSCSDISEIQELRSVANTQTSLGEDLV